MTNTPLGRLLGTCELIVEQNFIGGWLLVDYFSEPVRQFTDILRKLPSEVLEKVMSLRSGGLLYVLGFLFAADGDAVYGMQNKRSSLFI